MSGNAEIHPFTYARAPSLSVIGWGTVQSWITKPSANSPTNASGS